MPALVHPTCSIQEIYWSLRALHPITPTQRHRRRASSRMAMGFLTFRPLWRFATDRSLSALAVKTSKAPRKHSTVPAQQHGTARYTDRSTYVLAQDNHRYQESNPVSLTECTQYSRSAVFSPPTAFECGLERHKITCFAVCTS